VLYVFAGLKRKNSIADYLRKFAKQFHLRVEVQELDIQRCRKMDLTVPRIQKKWLNLVSSGRYFAVVVTPPCSTFSRAVWANEEGPF